jgi:hypothetical protein
MQRFDPGVNEQVQNAYKPSIKASGTGPPIYSPFCPAASGIRQFRHFFLLYLRLKICYSLQVMDIKRNIGTLGENLTRKNLHSVRPEIGQLGRVQGARKILPQAYG